MSNDANNPDDARFLAIRLIKPKSADPIHVTSAAFAYCEPIPHKHSAYGEMHSPPISFDNVPPETKTLTLLLEDPDAPSAKPFVHWVLVNFPPRTPYLRENLPTFDFLPDLGDALQGKNSAGKVGYCGMKPPKGHPPHNYHFSVFAVDKELTFAKDEPVDRDTVLKKLDGHVLAMGDLVGTFAPPK